MTLIPNFWSRSRPALPAAVIDDRAVLVSRLAIQVSENATLRHNLVEAWKGWEDCAAEVVSLRAVLGDDGSWERLARRQADLLAGLEKSQHARDTEMAEHLNKNVCTPREAPPAVVGPPVSKLAFLSPGEAQRMLAAAAEGAA